MHKSKTKTNQDPQGRGWTIVLNNPESYGLVRLLIIAILKAMNLVYWCLAEEVSMTGTKHTHVYLYAKSNMRFSTIQRKFPHAHIERAKGSAAQNRDYIMKAGKWAESEKSETSIPGSFEEWGELPAGRRKKNVDSAKITSMVDNIIERMTNGETALEIMRDNRMMRLGLHKIGEIWKEHLYEKSKNVFRDIDVTYIYGDTGVGKTYSIFQMHNAEDIFRITNYRKGNSVYFDRYNAEPVLVFEEFCGQVSIEEMLNYLDCYPNRLPARYEDCVANFTTVFITSNVPLEQQYRDIQVNKPETWKAFLRRINNVIELRRDGDKIIHIIHKGVDVTRQHNETA